MGLERNKDEQMKTEFKFLVNSPLNPEALEEPIKNVTCTFEAEIDKYAVESIQRAYLSSSRGEHLLP